MLKRIAANRKHTALLSRRTKSDGEEGRRCAERRRDENSGIVSILGRWAHIARRAGAASAGPQNRPYTDCCSLPMFHFFCHAPRPIPGDSRSHRHGQRSTSGDVQPELLGMFGTVNRDASLDERILEHAQRPVLPPRAPHVQAHQCHVLRLPFCQRRRTRRLSGIAVPRRARLKAQIAESFPRRLAVRVAPAHCLRMGGTDSGCCTRSPRQSNTTQLFGSLGRHTPHLSLVPPPKFLRYISYSAMGIEDFGRRSRTLEGRL
ncbi:hypothetical protein C8Q78DRAFT_657487 [Trametes maxima]|nr:hypothetical protein C8Q78DRAFT_657487 [Trametes maxima]